MAKAKRRKRFYFSVVATVLLFLVVGVLVVVVRLRTTIPSREEPPELVAKRLDTENNAYYALMEAVRLLPKAPEPLILKDEDGWEYKYQPEVDSLGDILRIRRPDDDALLLEYVAKSMAATDQALKALGKPWFLYPPAPEKGPLTEDEELAAFFEMQWWIVQDRQAMWQLVTLLQVHALLDPCSEDDAADGCRHLIESIKLASLINQDGIQWRIIKPRLALDILRKTRPDHLGRMVDALSLLRNAYSPGRDFDVLVHHLYGKSASAFLAGIDASEVGWVVISGMLWREKLFTARHQALLRQACFLATKQYERLKEEHPTLEKAEEVLEFYSIVPDLPTKNSVVLATVDGFSLALALELYKKEKSEYPELLDALVPTYLPALPENPFLGGPFNYKRVESDYILSCGYEYQERLKKELVFHAP
ncbi:MAG TPA: hypothetical protein VMZ06_03945 [Candidatus Bathyarchaeia archaeon]|nr:hypothetical protein [Candidatus Bathyarchaeia archaeon]